MNEWMKDHIIMSLSEILDSPSLPVPDHLRSFVKSHIKRWANSVIKAVIYEKDREYIVYDNVRNSKTRKIIAPVNSETGSIQPSLVLTDALTQFLQIKEALYQTAEGLTNVFTSYFGYFLRYQKRIFGLTGTVGKLWHQKFLDDVYSTPSIILPKFIPSKMERHPMKTPSNQAEWLDDIIAEANGAFHNSRATLILTDYVEEVHLIAKKLKESGYKGRIYEYFDGQKHEDIVEKLIRPGDVIIATQQGGRGTDLIIAREVEIHGGLLVIQTSYPSSSRVSDQGCGRGARKGERGSCITIINAETYPELVAECGTDISCFHKIRDENEIEKLNDLYVCSLPGKKLEDWLFQEHVRNIRISTSPTGFEIVILRGDVTEKELAKQADDQLYVYSSLITTGWFWSKSESKIYLQALKKEPIDITNTIAKLDENLLDHLRTVLSLEGTTLNGRCYELIHFIAAYNGISTRSDIIARVIAKYEQLWSIDNGLSDVVQSNIEYKNDFVVPEEYNFLENLAFESGMNITDSEQKIEDLKLLKFKELFRLWNEDREIYNDQQFIRENNQQFGMHYKEHQYLMMPHPECNSSDSFGEQYRDQLRAEELRNKSESFFETSKKAKLRNPAYMLHQAFSYEQIDVQEDWLKGNTARKSSLGVFSNSGYNIVVKGIYGFLPKAAIGFWGYVIKTATGIMAKTGIEVLQNLQQGFMKTSDVFVPNALDLAYKFAQDASLADPFYNWWGKNALSYFTLRSKGEAIFHIDDAQKAVNVMKEFGSYQNAAAYGLNSYNDISEGYLNKMLMERHVPRNSPFALQKKAEIELRKAYIYIMVENVKEVRNVFNNFEDSPSILRVKEVISKSKLMKLVNIEAIREFYEPSILNGTAQSEFAEKDFNISDIEQFTINILNNSINGTRLNEECTENLNQANIKDQAFSNLNSLTQNPTNIDVESLLETTMNEMFAQGAFIFTVQRQALEEEDDEWIGALVSGIFGIVQIVIGAALLNPAGIASGIGVFTTTLATGMIVSGISDIISTLVSVINNTPINVEDYFKSKAINFAVTLITAGALHALSSIDSLRVMVDIADMNRKFIDKLQKMGMFQYLTQHILFQASMYGLGQLTSKQAKDYTKRNSGDIKNDAQKASTSIIDATYESYLRKIFAYDEAHGTTTTMSELENYARQITADYSTRFQDSGTRIGRGVFSKTAGTVLGGFGMMGQVASTVINSATDLSFGFIKIAGASKDFKQKMIQKIKDQAQNLPSSKSMMQSYLEINSNNAQAIMEELNKAGFIISNEDIDYKNCPKIITLNLNEFNATKDTILTNCNRIAQYMGATDNHQTQRTALQKNLAQTFITQLQGTFSTEIVQPVMNIPAGYAAGYVSEKFAESLAKLAKSGKQEPTEDADPVKIKNKKKNKFTPTKRGDSSNQEEAVETNDENSPNKPFKKFTKTKNPNFEEPFTSESDFMDQYLDKIFPWRKLLKNGESSDSFSQTSESRFSDKQSLLPIEKFLQTLQKKQPIAYYMTINKRLFLQQQHYAAYLYSQYLKTGSVENSQISLSEFDVHSLATSVQIIKGFFKEKLPTTTSLISLPIEFSKEVMGAVGRIITSLFIDPYFKNIELTNPKAHAEITQFQKDVVQATKNWFDNLAPDVQETIKDVFDISDVVGTTALFKGAIKSGITAEIGSASKSSITTEIKALSNEAKLTLSNAIKKLKTRFDDIIPPFKPTFATAEGISLNNLGKLLKNNNLNKNPSLFKTISDDVGTKVSKTKFPDKKIKPDSGSKSNMKDPINFGKNEITFPTNDAQVKHIFANREGHILDTAKHRKLILNVANDKRNFLKVDKWDNKWYSKTLSDGRQIWVQVYKDGTINNAGINKVPINILKEHANKFK